MKTNTVILFSGGIKGAEAEFGEQAERFGIEEVNFTFEGHTVIRPRGRRILSEEELKRGDVSLAYVSKLMHRRYTESPAFRRILQSIWHQIDSGQQIFVIGEILEDRTVRGGTGWGAELAKLFNKTLYVFDQKQDEWFLWDQSEWVECEKEAQPVVIANRFTGTGTRFLQPNGKEAVVKLFERSFA